MDSLGKYKAFLALTTAASSFGSASILIRLAGSVSPVNLTLYRLAIGWLAVLIFALWRGSLRDFPRYSNIATMLVSGVILALHFIAFIYALQTTTVASASFLVNTSPIFVATLALLLLKEKPSLLEVAGVLLASSGVATIFVLNSQGGISPSGLGELAALLAALLMAAYTLLGRKLRAGGVGASVYVVYVYGFAAISTLLMQLTAGSNPVQTGMLEPMAILAIIGLGLIPTVLGHGLYNYALGLAHALPVSLFATLEPVIASVAALFLFSEIPSPQHVVGYVLIAIGVVVGSKSMLLRGN